jgi:hypothetical protein
MATVNALIYFNCNLFSFHTHRPTKAAYDILVLQNKMRCLQKPFGENSGDWPGIPFQSRLISTRKTLLSGFSFMMSELNVSTDFVLKHSVICDIFSSVYMSFIMPLFTH